MLEKTLEGSLDSKEINLINTKGNQSCIFIRRTDAEAEAPVLPAILIPACASSSPAFLMMYYAYKLNKQGDSIHLDVLLSLFGTTLLFHA